jgi:hypothetical protein
MKNVSNKLVLVLRYKSQVSIRCHQINSELSIWEWTFIYFYKKKKNKTKYSNKSRLSVGNSFTVLNDFFSEMI